VKGSGGQVFEGAREGRNLLISDTLEVQ